MNIKYDILNLKIESRVIELITKYIQIQSASKEAGGMLIGSRVIYSNDIIIEKCTEPMLHDLRQRYFYFRSKEHNHLLDIMWKESNNTCMYLGEWHTHPESVPSPSYVDLNNWKKLLKKSETNSQYLIFVIVGIEYIGVWIGNRETNKIDLMYRGKMRINYENNI